MTEAFGNLWDYPADWRVITTNGTVKQNGEAVMGRGCAAEAKAKFPGIAKALGTHLASVGNIMCVATELKLLTFPVKHHWFQDADPRLIEESAADLARFARAIAPATIVLPRPGCGNGRLSWAMVKPLLADLPDNVVVITFPEGSAQDGGMKGGRR